MLELTLDDLNTIKRGDRGQAVQLVQEALETLGFELQRFGADGDFGAETDSAVRNYQRRRGLKVDAMVGPETLGRLDTELVRHGGDASQRPLPPAPTPQERPEPGCFNPRTISQATGCIGVNGDVSGSNFRFQVNCVNLLSGERRRLDGFIDSTTPTDQIEVHGFASEEGPQEFNEHLSCLRALAVASLIAGRGRSGQIKGVFKHGATGGDRAERRSVVLKVVSTRGPTPDKPPGPLPMPAKCTIAGAAGSVRAVHARYGAIEGLGINGSFRTDATASVFDASGECHLFVDAAINTAAVMFAPVRGTGSVRVFVDGQERGPFAFRAPRRPIIHGPTTVIIGDVTIPIPDGTRSLKLEIRTGYLLTQPGGGFNTSAVDEVTIIP